MEYLEVLGKMLSIFFSSLHQFSCFVVEFEFLIRTPVSRSRASEYSRIGVYSCGWVARCGRAPKRQANPF